MALKKSLNRKPVVFSFKNPSAKSVSVCGTFNGWKPEKLLSAGKSEAAWTTQIQLKPGRYEYKFVIDDTWVKDPANSETVDDGYGAANSVIVVPA